MSPMLQRTENTQQHYCTNEEGPDQTRLHKTRAENEEKKELQLRQVTTAASIVVSDRFYRAGCVTVML